MVATDSFGRRRCIICAIVPMWFQSISLWSWGATGGSTSLYPYYFCLCFPSFVWFLANTYVADIIPGNARAAFFAFNSALQVHTQPIDLHGQYELRVLSAGCLWLQVELHKYVGQRRGRAICATGSRAAGDDTGSARKYLSTREYTPQSPSQLDSQG